VSAVKTKSRGLRPADSKTMISPLPPLVENAKVLLPQVWNGPTSRSSHDQDVHKDKIGIGPKVGRWNRLSEAERAIQNQPGRNRGGEHETRRRLEPPRPCGPNASEWMPR